MMIDSGHSGYPSPRPGEKLHPSAVVLVARITNPQLDSGLADKARLLGRIQFQTLSVWRLLFDHCVRLGPYRPTEQLPVAELALGLAERLPLGHYGFRVVKDCQGLAAALLSECHLRQQRLGEAEDRLCVAEKAAAAGAGVPRVLAPIWMVRALLHRANGHWDLAEQLLARVADHFGRIPDLELQGVALIRRGVLLEKLGRSSESYEALSQGLERCRDPHWAALQWQGVKALARQIQLRG